VARRGPANVPKSRFPCMGLVKEFRQSGASFFPSSVSLFDLKARVKVGRRTNLAACSNFCQATP
jgi:hypothetical protein